MGGEGQLQLEVDCSEGCGQFEWISEAVALCSPQVLSGRWVSTEVEAGGHR